ncbi:hypothetical protein SAMN05216391_10871 [Lachnospiraceae bacterium KHCPX20]|nr:hypothetical protein SAMN05216391_10871 [Lachnospiraceae bacterium KHCPX20]
MIEIVEACTKSGREWCCSCLKRTETKRIKFSQDGSNGTSVVLCDNCRRKLVKLIMENEDKA